ncbi:MAG: fibronectin type III domain-containing protein [Deltaproteobacteria bacterium]|nr:fibronectin type III domain-containing protein [Deltaproteobacteria bacterium]MBZ0219542.1 fibronectin type III domain-containing protein [Deltaproteobacteria bacterium]
MKTVFIYAFLAVFIFVTGCGGGGGGNLGSSNNNEPLYFEEGSSFVPYQVASVKSSNLTLSSDSYQGTLDGNPITIYRISGDTLAFLLPELSPGAHTIDIDIEGEAYSLPLTVGSLPSIEDPEAYINDLVTSVAGSLDEQINSLTGVAGSEEILSKLIEVRDNLAAQSANMDSLSQEEKLWLANFLNANIMAGNAMTAASLKAFSESDCLNGTIQFVGSVLRTKALVGAAAVAIIAGQTMPILGAIAAGIAVGLLLDSLVKTLADEEHALTKCVGKLFDDILESKNLSTGPGIVLVSMKTVAAGVSTSNPSFDSGVPMTFQIMSTYSIRNAQLKSAVETLKSVITPVISLLPQAWVDQIMGVDAENTLTEVADPADYAIQSISSSNIRGSSRALGDKIELTFEFLQDPSSDQDVPFSFVLYDGIEEVSTTVSATLSKISALTGLEATSGVEQVALNWNPVQGATGYKVYWLTSTGVSKTNYMGTAEATGTSYTVMGLSRGTTYYFVVTSLDSTGIESNESNEMSKKTNTFEGTYAGGEANTAPSGESWIYTESDTVSGDSVSGVYSGYYSITNSVVFLFSWTGNITLSPSNPNHGIITGSGTLSNSGNLSFLTVSGQVTTYADGTAMLCWGAEDWTYGPFGLCTHRPSAQ